MTGADLNSPTDPYAAPWTGQTRRAVTLAGAIAVAYLAVTLVPIIRYTRSSGELGPSAAHVVALLIGAALLASRAPRAQGWRAWLPLLLGPFLYWELRWLIPGLGHAHQDAMVIAWEHSLFPSDPSRTLAERFYHPAASELLHFAYASYYGIVLVPPALLYLRAKREEYAQTLLTLSLVYAVCFITFMLFPVDGPRFLHGPAAAPPGPIRDAVLSLLDSASARGTAFPSSHVAAAVVASVCALRFQPWIGRLAAVLTALLIVGTVYGGFHYGVDVLAGLIVGALVSIVGAIAWRLLGGDARNATAAQ